MLKGWCIFRGSLILVSKSVDFLSYLTRSSNFCTHFYLSKIFFPGNHWKIFLIGIYPEFDLISNNTTIAYSASASGFVKNWIQKKLEKSHSIIFSAPLSKAHIATPYRNNWSCVVDLRSILRSIDCIVEYGSQLQRERRRRIMVI